MKEVFRTVVALLRKYNRLWVVILSFLVMAGLVAVALFINMLDLFYAASLLLVMISWEISDVFLFEKQAVVEEELANEKDKLILATHDVERLKLELETTQAALKEVQRRKEYSGYVQTGFSQVKAKGNTASIDTAETAVADAASADIQTPKPRPKRRPAPKRKPKQTENVNENKD